MSRRTPASASSPAGRFSAMLLREAIAGAPGRARPAQRARSSYSPAARGFSRPSRAARASRARRRGGGARRRRRTRGPAESAVPATSASSAPTAASSIAAAPSTPPSRRAPTRCCRVALASGASPCSGGVQRRDQQRARLRQHASSAAAESRSSSASSRDRRRRRASGPPSPRTARGRLAVQLDRRVDLAAALASAPGCTPPTPTPGALPRVDSDSVAPARVLAALVAAGRERRHRRPELRIRRSDGGGVYTEDDEQNCARRARAARGAARGGACQQPHRELHARKLARVVFDFPAPSMQPIGTNAILNDESYEKDESLKLAHDCSGGAALADGDGRPQSQCSCQGGGVGGAAPEAGGRRLLFSPVGRVHRRVDREVEQSRGGVTCK